MKRWKIVGRNKNDHVYNAVITVSVDDESNGWRFRYTATIYGFRGFLIAEGCPGLGELNYEDVCKKVGEIRDRIEAGDKSVFCEDHCICLSPKDSHMAARNAEAIRAWDARSAKIRADMQQHFIDHMIGSLEAADSEFLMTGKTKEVKPASECAYCKGTGVIGLVSCPFCLGGRLSGSE